MSGSMQSLRRKIDGAGDLEGVVRSMKALAASSIGQYEKAVQSLDDYYRTIEVGLSACLRHAGPAEAPSPKRTKDAAPLGAVVFGSDQGLVGRFNEVVVEFALDSLKKLPGKTKQIWAVGDRARTLLLDTGLAPVSLLPVPASVQAITPRVGEILIEIEAAREQGKISEVYVFHNHPNPVLSMSLPASECCRWTGRGKLSWPQNPGPLKRCRKSWKEARRARGLRSGLPVCVAVFKPARNL